MASIASSKVFQTEFEWKYIDYNWLSEGQKDAYIGADLYDHTKIVLIDVDRAPDGRTFVTASMREGAPVTLATVSSEVGKGGPLLSPYPNWDYYEKSDICQGIVSVYRIFIDNCDRLWLLDNGWIGNKYKCPAKLLAFNLTSDQEVVRHVLDDRVAKGKNGASLFVTPIVKTNRRCNSTTVYMADALGHGLVIYKNGKTVRLEGDVYAPDTKHSRVSLGGFDFWVSLGVIGMALSPRKDGKRTLFFRSFSSLSIYAADTRELEKSFKNGTVNYLRGTDILPSQGSAMAFSSHHGVMFYGLANKTDIGCYRVRNSLKPENLGIIPTEEVIFRFVSGMKVKRMKHKRDYLLVMTNRYQKFSLRTVNFSEINYRVVSAPVDSLIRKSIACTLLND
ncbi:major royal jelly protein 2-like [Copidosoma floridanum]|uniref:major royal jelly protein 2-like n=1 Tax=Copidosoma floridanum TaxID=29053 RepID=UPI0006C9555B|nr:major royal jelly protein 2-like [Copidosoma floridanum]